MPTLLYRVLSSMGYPEEREPRYYWDKEPLGDETLVGIEAVVPTSGGDPAWGGWVYESRGVPRCPYQGSFRSFEGPHGEVSTGAGPRLRWGVSPG